MTLAGRWGACMHSAALVGLAHDLAKELEPDALRADIERRGQRIDPEDEPFHPVWHGQAAALWAEQDFQITDPAVLEAIRLHATTDVGVSLLTRIAFVADMIEPARHWVGVQAMRRLAQEDFDAAFAEVIKVKIEHVLAKGKDVHPRALRALEAFRPAKDQLVEEGTYGQG